jgi:LacI family transcriptional regulator
LATLKDIGAELGLSVATVSRALNGFPEVNARTRASVEEVARRLNYRPNRLAQKLVSGRSGIVGMIVRMDRQMATDHSFVDFMMQMSARLSQRDVDLVFQVVADTDPIAPYQRMMQKNILDGFILNAPLIDDSRVGFLAENRIPFVVHGRTTGPAAYPFYDLDNYGVSAAAVSLLADLGHRRIGLLNGLAVFSFAAQRLRGFRETLAQNGIRTPDAFVFHGRHSGDYGYTAALSAISGRLGPPPTALICASTQIAAGAMRAARDRGLNIPADLSVIAHDDDAPELGSLHIDPPLTVTHAAMRDACGPLADKLIGAMSGIPASRLQTTAPFELEIRASTGPVPEGGRDPWI